MINVFNFLSAQPEVEFSVATYPVTTTPGEPEPHTTTDNDESEVSDELEIAQEENNEELKTQVVYQHHQNSSHDIIIIPTFEI